MENEQLSKNEIERRQRTNDARRRRIKKIIIWLVVLVVIAGAVYGLVILSKKSAENKPGEESPDQGNLHIDVGAAHEAYNSNPPTSGPHYERPANWGFYTEPLPDEQLVHNLEHGGIWISYKDPSAPFLEDLREFTKRYAIKVIVTPRPANDSPIAVAAWRRLLKLESFDRDQIENFIKVYINKGPEKVDF